MKKVITVLSLVLILTSCSTTEEFRETFENEVVLTEKPRLFIDVGAPQLKDSEASANVVVEYYDGTRVTIVALAEDGVIIADLAEKDANILTVKVEILIQQGQGVIDVYLYSSNMEELYYDPTIISEGDVLKYNFDYQELLNQ